MSDDRFNEPKRARRIRDRDRMRARGMRHQKLQHPKPYGVPGEGMAWRDAEHAEHHGWATWADVHAFRRVRGIVGGDTLASCSCHVCGNPRRYWNAVTGQEVRSLLSADWQCAEEGLAPISRGARPNRG